MVFWLKNLLYIFGKIVKAAVEKSEFLFFNVISLIQKSVESILKYFLIFNSFKLVYSYPWSTIFIKIVPNFCQRPEIQILNVIQPSFWTRWGTRFCSQKLAKQGPPQMGRGYHTIQQFFGCWGQAWHFWCPEFPHRAIESKIKNSLFSNL